MGETTMRHDWHAAQAMATAQVRAALTGAPWRGARNGSVRGWSAFGRSALAIARGTFSALRPVRLRCLIVGHDDYLAREPLRLFLRCGACGRGTHGWVMAANRPRVTAGIVRRGRREAAAV